MNDAQRAVDRWGHLSSAEIEDRLNKSAIEYRRIWYEDRWIMYDGSAVVSDVYDDEGKARDDSRRRYYHAENDGDAE